MRQAASSAVFASAAPLWAHFQREPGTGDRGPAASTSEARTQAPARPVDPARVQELADALRTSPRERVFDLAAEKIRRGATQREMLGGVLLAGVQDVRPWPPGVKFHVVLMVPSAMQLSEAADAEDSWLPIFFNINVLKDAQEMDVREGDWSLPPAPSPLTDDPARARRSLIDSLERWDLETADRAATAAARLLDPDDLFEILWPMGARDFSNIGHLMIHASQAHRALRMIDGHHREPVIRSLVHGLLGGRPGRTTAFFERNRERIPEIPAGWEAGRPDPEVSHEILIKMRTATAGEAVDLILALLKRGVAAESIWDGLRLIASEILFRLAGSTIRNAQLLGVHPMTILNAFDHASRTTSREQTRRLLLLQAAAWLPTARDVLQGSKGLSMKGPGLDGLEISDDPGTVEKAIEEASRSHLRSASLSFRVTREPQRAAEFIRRFRSLTLRKAAEHHHHKYAAAVFEEFPRTNPRWGSYLLAVCPSYLSNPADPDSEVTARARAALAKAGA